MTTFQLTNRIPCPECKGGERPIPGGWRCEVCHGDKTVPGELELEDLIGLVFERLMESYSEKRRSVAQLEDKLTAMVEARCANVEESVRLLREEIRCLSFPRGE